MKNLAFKRRRKGITDYYQRYRLVKSGRHRMVIRPSLNHIQIQIVRSEKDGDKTVISVHSKELEKLGYKGHCGNCVAAYLTGLFCGYKIKKEKIDNVILDIGLKSATKGANIFAVLKGVLDAGISIPHNENILPSDERIRGEHIAAYASSLSEEAYNRQFSRYVDKGLKPENIPDHFDEIKKKIEGMA
jgi:large subunit ribosomal protein L18